MKSLRRTEIIGANVNGQNGRPNPIILPSLSLSLPRCAQNIKFSDLEVLNLAFPSTFSLSPSLPRNPKPLLKAKPSNGHQFFVYLYSHIIHFKLIIHHQPVASSLLLFLCFFLCIFSLFYFFDFCGRLFPFGQQFLL